MGPVVISKQLVHPFSFYLGGQIREGMRHGNALYGLVYESQTHHRLKIYQLASDLADQGVPVVITTDGSAYAVWVSLQSPAYCNLDVPVQDLVQPLNLAA